MKLGMKIVIMKEQNQLSRFLKNFSYTFSANIFQMITSTIITLVLPRFYEIEVYSYWQLYLLYFSYVGILQLGWSDGIYLRYAGMDYEKLDKKIFSFQFWYLVLMYFGLSFIVFIISFIAFSHRLNLQILMYVLIAGLFIVPRATLYYILQGTNRITDFAKMNILEKLVFIVVLLTSFGLGVRSLQSVIYADLLGKLFSLLGSIYLTRDIVFSKCVNFITGIQEAFENMGAGIKLMIANIASTLIIGVIRFSIEQHWGLQVFGKISLTLTISNLLMLFINSMGIVIFPMLKRVNESKLRPLYLTIRTGLMVPLLAILVLYFPMQLILSAWLPQYSESLRYMALLFPIVVFESKTSLLINTYLKSLRKESVMLYINISAVLVSLITSFITIKVLNNLTYTIISIVFLLAFRVVVAEVYVGKILKISVFKDITFELLLTSIFMYTNWTIGGFKGVLLYLVAYLVYLFFQKQAIRNSIKSFKTLNE